MENREIIEGLKLVAKAIERTGDFALNSKTKKEQEMMKFLQENCSELYYSMIGKMAMLGSNDLWLLNIEENKNHGIDIVFHSVETEKASFLVDVSEKTNEKVMLPEDNEPQK